MAMAMSIRTITTTSASTIVPSSYSRLHSTRNHRDHRSYFFGNPKLQISHLKVVQNGSKIKKMNMVVNSVEPGTPLPSDPSSGSWKLWIAGILVSVILPFWKNKWWPLLKIKEQVESAVEAVEDVVEIVEKVAEGVEDVADEIGDRLPAGGKLQKAAMLVEKLAKETAKDAALADDLIEKVESVEKEMDSIIDKATEEIKKKNDIKNEKAVQN